LVLFPHYIVWAWSFQCLSKQCNFPVFPSIYSASPITHNCSLTGTNGNTYNLNENKTFQSFYFLLIMMSIWFYLKVIYVILYSQQVFNYLMIGLVFKYISYIWRIKHQISVAQYNGLFWMSQILWMATNLACVL
jgi:hypothetical protein